MSRPFFYVGDKYRLMPQLRELFPRYISTYIKPFAGGGSSFLNTPAERYLVNGIDFYAIALHETLSECVGRREELFDYAHYNREDYLQLRVDFNEGHDLLILHLLLIYEFNHMFRFNKNVYEAICQYLNFMEQNDMSFYNLDFASFVDQIQLDEDSYVYFDQPYLISGSEYNKH